MIALLFLACLVSALVTPLLPWPKRRSWSARLFPMRGCRGFAGLSGSPRRRGLFEKYGLDVRLVQITAGTTSINAMIAGDVDMAITTSSAAIAAALRGAPVTIIATGGAPPYKLVAHPSVTSALQLKGTLVGSS